jgi:hypothetical protein
VRHERLLSKAKTAARLAGFDLLRSAGTRRWSHRPHPIRLPPPFDRRSLSPASTFEVPVELATTAVGFGYGSGGWHPYVASLEEYRAEPGLRYEDSSLARLQTVFQPVNLQEVLFGATVEPLAPLHRWPPRQYFLYRIWTMNPWLEKEALERFPAEERVGWLYFGPTTPKLRESGKADLLRLMRVYESIRTQGLRSGPDVAPLKGYFLSSGDSYRFVVLEGNHRVAALRSLGIESFPARLHPGWPAVVRAERLHPWTHQAGGVYPSETVEKLFWMLFEETGANKAANLGLI